MRRYTTTLPALLAGFFLILTLAPATAAGGDREGGDLDHLKAKIQALMQEAAAAKAEGRHDHARELVEMAEQLEEKYHAMQRGREKGRREGPKEIRLEEVPKILEGLERGIGALKRLGKMEDAKRLAKYAEGLRREVAQHGGKNRERTTERETVSKQLEVLRLGMKALLEGDRRDAAEIVEHAIHARELMLEGRKGREAAEVLETAPGAGPLAEVLFLAAELWQDFGHERNAKTVATLAREFQQAAGKRDRPREKGQDRERKLVQHHLEIMRQAMIALREGERREAMELLEHAIHARELGLAGRKDREAAEIRESSPGPGVLAEVLMMAADLWLEFGHEQKAAMVDELARYFQEHARKRAEREHGAREKDRPHPEAEHRVRELEARLAELQEMLHHLMEELNALRHDLK